MTRLHIVVEIDDAIDAHTTDAEEFARGVLGPGRRGALAAASWDLFQQPPEEIAAAMFPRAVAIIADYTGTDGVERGVGLFLPGPFGTFHLTRHYRPAPTWGAGHVSVDPPDKLDHVSFAGQIEGGYSMLTRPTLADTAAALGDLFTETLDG